MTLADIHDIHDAAAAYEQQSPFEFCIVEVSVTYVSQSEVLGGDYAEVACWLHHWQCAHRHRRWGPWVRCATRHQEENE